VFSCKELVKRVRRYVEHFAGAINSDVRQYCSGPATKLHVVVMNIFHRETDSEFCRVKKTARTPTQFLTTPSLTVREGGRCQV